MGLSSNDRNSMMESRTSLGNGGIASGLGETQDRVGGLSLRSSNAGRSPRIRTAVSGSSIASMNSPISPFRESPYIFRDPGIC
jgi:hypothetical protein